MNPSAVLPFAGRFSEIVNSRLVARYHDDADRAGGDRIAGKLVVGNLIVISWLGPVCRGHRHEALDLKVASTSEMDKPVMADQVSASLNTDPADHGMRCDLTIHVAVEGKSVDMALVHTMETIAADLKNRFVLIVHSKARRCLNCRPIPSNIAIGDGCENIGSDIRSLCEFDYARVCC